MEDPRKWGANRGANRYARQKVFDFDGLIQLFEGFLANNEKNQYLLKKHFDHIEELLQALKALKLAEKYFKWHPKTHSLLMKEVGAKVFELFAAVICEVMEDRTLEEVVELVQGIAKYVKL